MVTLSVYNSKKVTFERKKFKKSEIKGLMKHPKTGSTILLVQRKNKRIWFELGGSVEKATEILDYKPW